MAKRTIYKSPDGKRWIKVNLPMYVGLDMIEGLAKLSGKSQQFIIDNVIGRMAQAAANQIGIGHVEEDYVYLYVDEDDGYPTQSMKMYGRFESGKPKKGKYWSLPDNIEFLK